MPTIDTSSFKFASTPEARFLHLGEIKLPVFVRFFQPPNASYAVAYPTTHIGGRLWGLYLAACRKYAAYDPKATMWVWSKLALDKLTSPDAVQSLKTPAALTRDEREKIKEERRQQEVNFEKHLAELSKAENVPEEQWDSYQYPKHYVPCDPHPTALQRIIVSRYWDKKCALLGASVGSGKSRMVLDMLAARQLSPKHCDAARIVLLVAPLSLHENWVREIRKWSPKSVDWRVHRYHPKVWLAIERDAADLFADPMPPGGIIIICTHQALSRPTLINQLASYGCDPTAIVIDEIQRFFRKPENSAYKNLCKIRAKAHICIGLSGTPASKLEDWWCLEELITGGVSDAHWNGAAYPDYQKLGDRELCTSSGLWKKGWTFERAIQEFHVNRIKQRRIFLANKNFYMKDSLPGLEQEELGPYADTRLSFNQLFDDEALVKRACAFHKKAGGAPLSGANVATTLLLRLQQLAALESDPLILNFVEEFLDKGEPCVFWTLFRNEPCAELPRIVKLLSKVAPTTYLTGGMSEADRWAAIDGFHNGRFTYMVNQTEAGGVGLNLVRACKTLFCSTPFGYQAVSQCIGRLHRIGQDKDVTSYFAMHSPVTAFARMIYDRRVNLNETIPNSLNAYLVKLVVDSKPVTA